MPACRSPWALLGVLGVALGCAPAPLTLTDTLRLYEVGRDAEFRRACEDEYARWERVDPAVTAALPAAQAALAAAREADPFGWGGPVRLAPAAGTSDALGDDLAPLARVDFRTRGGGALRAVGAAILSDAPLAVARATVQAGALGDRRLLPHLAAHLFSARPLPGEAGPLAAFTGPVRILLTKALARDAVRAILDGRPPTPPGGVE